MTIWLTSDLHLGHLNILTYCDRPFRSVDEMNSMLVDNWNSVVQPSDQVLVLGDFAMGKIDDTLPIALRLNGTKLLVAGNHDRCWSFNHKKIDAWRARYEEVGFTILPEQVTTLAAGSTTVVLCHFPYEGDSHDEDRFLAARPVDDRIPLFHGHTHAREPLTFSKRGTPMVNVGVDAWGYFPVSLDAVLALLRK